MNRKLVEKIQHDFKWFPTKNPLFREDLNAPMWVDTDDGWFALIYDLCKKIDIIVKRKKIDFYVDQVKEKFGCYDKETELLTKNGWKYFKDVTYEDKIATLSYDGYLEYQKPTDVIVYFYEGLMYKLKTRAVDLLVTPNHNLFVSKGGYWNGKYKPPIKREYPFELINPEKYFKKDKRFKMGAKWSSKEIEYFILPEYRYSNFTKLTGNRIYIKKEIKINMDAWLNFLGWYLSEGHAERVETNISCNNTDGGKEKKLISSSIKNIGYPLHIGREDKPALSFRIYSVQLTQWLTNNCGRTALEKRVPTFVKDLPTRQILILLRSLYLGDGYKGKTWKCLSSISKKLVDDVQELLLKSGFCGSIDKKPPVPNKSNTIIGKHDVYVINWLKNSYHNTQSKAFAKSSFENFIPYKGNVCCVSVPNKVIYVRRNGSPIWCGNSLRFYVSGANDEIRELINEAEAKSFRTCEICGNAGTSYISVGWYKTLCANCASADKKHDWVKLKEPIESIKWK